MADKNERNMGYQQKIGIPGFFQFPIIFIQPNICKAPKKATENEITTVAIGKIFAAAVYTNTTPASSIDSESCRVRDGDHQGTSGHQNNKNGRYTLLEGK